MYHRCDGCTIVPSDYGKKELRMKLHRLKHIVHLDYQQFIDIDSFSIMQKVLMDQVIQLCLLAAINNNFKHYSANQQLIRFSVFATKQWYSVVFTIYMYMW